MRWAWEAGLGGRGEEEGLRLGGSGVRGGGLEKAGGNISEGRKQKVERHHGMTAAGIAVRRRLGSGMLLPLRCTVAEI